jgi:hypothetical protein
MTWYTWVFDGVGSTVLVSAGVALYRKYVSKSPADQPMLAAAHSIAHPPEGASTEPTPVQILKEIDAALPFDREHARERYRGLNVAWRLSILSVSSKNEFNIVNGVVDRNQHWSFICLFPAGTPDAGVSFNLKTVPPELKLLKAGSILWVQGIINRVSEFGSISLEDEPRILEIVRR